MKELLIPVGNMECLKIAVFSGADAVYLGGKKFGARAYAENFSTIDMIEAIQFCHLYGVKIYVTINTLVHESEFDEVISYVAFLYENGVDAIIVQDLGLIKECHYLFPNLEIHASTQVHNTNEEGVLFLEKLGVKRVVYARELSLKEINNIKTPLEKEVFIHGALCVAYSGQCLFSSLLLGRSGNRGSCAQICRLPFSLYRENKKIETEGNYLLSTRELNTSQYFKDIMESDIYSLKVEGRMKSPEYVGCVTKIYRHIIDFYSKTGKIDVPKALLEDLDVIFNREYTKGFLLSETNKNIVNTKTSNHLGTEIGRVIQVDTKYVYIKLKKTLIQGDGIRFISSNEGQIVNFLFNEKKELIHDAHKDQIVLLERRGNPLKEETVNKTYSIEVSKKYREVEAKKIPITLFFEAKEGKMEIVISDGVHELKKESASVYLATNATMDEDKIRKQLIKLGNTPFMCTNITVKLDGNLFIRVSDLNQLRRDAVINLEDIRRMEKRKVIKNPRREIHLQNVLKQEAQISVLCRTEEQIEAALSEHVSRIYIIDDKLFNQYKMYKQVFLRSKRVPKDVKYESNSLATELGAIEVSPNCITDYFINITNHYTLECLSPYTSINTLSVELEKEEVGQIMRYYQGEVEIILYGYIELMITKYCPLNKLINKQEACMICQNTTKYYLMDRNGKKYRIISDKETHLTHILHYKRVQQIADALFYKEMGIRHFRIELLEEDASETRKLIQQLRGELL